MSRSTIDRRGFLKLGPLGVALAAGAAGPVHAQEADTQKTEDTGAVNRTLGRTGLKVSVVGVGAMRTSEPSVLQAAFDHGVNFVHTGRSYMKGRNQGIVAQALKGYRDRVYVATKVKSSSKDDMLQKVDESLAALEVDYVDLVTRGSASSAEEVLDPGLREAMVQVRDEGKARFLGLPVHKNVTEVVNAVADDKDKFFDVILVAYNFQQDQALRDAIARVAKTGIGVIAMKTQAGGYQTKELGDISPHQAALKWVLQDTNVDMAIPAMVDLDQVKEDTEVMGMVLSEVDRQILSRYGDAIAPYHCTACARCEAACPRGVDVATVNRCLMYAEGYRDLPLARTTYAALAAERSAARCAECRECTAECVGRLDVAARMRQANVLFA